MSKALPKIEELTPAQEAQLDQYAAEWIKIGLACDPKVLSDQQRATVESAIARVYTCAGLSVPGQIIWTKSPLEGLKAAKKLNKDSSLGSAIYGSHDASWLSFYAYCREVLGLTEETEELTGLLEFAKVGGWAWCFDNAVVLSQRPVEVHVNAAGRLHKDMGPALLYADGFCLYELNGVRMEEKYVMARPDEISVNDAMKEQNVEVRRELLKKIGLPRFLKGSKAKVLDSYSIIGRSPRPVNYELLELALGDGITARVLKMDNPSIQEIHVEGVPDEIKTVKQALLWRIEEDTDESNYRDPEKLA